MKNSTLTTLIFAGVIGILALVFLNLSPTAPVNVRPDLAAQGNVNGIALFHNGTPFTLNFDQQNKALDYLNRGVTVKRSDYKTDKEAVHFDKLVIYRFEGGDLELTPFTTRDKNIVFSLPTLPQDSLLLEMSGGQLNSLLNLTYDP